MFNDLFGVTPAEINESNKAHAIFSATIVIALVEKGIITDDELEAARMKATHLIDQLFAAKREDAEKEFDEQHPGMRDLFKKLTGFEYDEKPIGKP